MSRTQRKDRIDIEPKRPDFVIWGETVNTQPTAKEVRRAHMDRKKYSKPGKRAKEYLTKHRRAKIKTVLTKVVIDPEAAPMPREKRSHVWDYN